MMGKISMQALALGLAGCLVAAPAMAGGRHGHRGYGHYGQGGHQRHYGGPSWQHYGHGGAHGPRHGGYRFYGGYAPYGRHHHRHIDGNDLALALGLTAVGLTAFGLWMSAQQAAYERAVVVPVGQAVVWDDGGAAGSVVPVSEGWAPNGEFCREFQKEIAVGGRVERGYGTACLQEDGSWRIAP